MSYQDAFEDARSGIRVVERSSYLTIEQDGRAFTARRWKLTQEVRGLLSKAISRGYGKLWQDERPKGGESSYISFSRTHHKDSWVFQIGLEARPPALAFVTFNKRYLADIVAAGVPYAVKQSGGQHILVAPENFDKALAQIEQGSSARPGS